MDLNLFNKNALITGSSKGIGLDIAKKLLSEGCNVVLNSRNEDDLKKIKSNYQQINYVSGDVTCEKSARKNIRKDY